MINVGIVGGTGYTGVELLRLLSHHHKVQVRFLTSRSEAGRAVCEVFPSLRGVCELKFCDMTDDTLQKMAEVCDVVFFATPHGVAMRYTPMLVRCGVKVIDLGADFRLQSLTDFYQWYQLEHTCIDVLRTAVYGLPEVNRHKIAGAHVIGNPGCYPTTVILGLKPVIALENQQETPLIEGRIIIDAKSGISGAGRNAKLGLMFGELSDNFSAYGVSGHRHCPEINQGVHEILGAKFVHRLRFVPHLVPMIRGMFSTIHIELTQAGQAMDWQAVFEDSYHDEYFVDVLPKGQLPDTRSVKASNKLRIGVYQADEVLTILVVQDNLVKGAAGQAIQNMNILFGLDEKTGLQLTPITP